MSQSEIERFLADLESNADLRAEVETLSLDKVKAIMVSSLVSFATGKGYAFTADEAKAVAPAERKTLTDAELCGVVGGIASENMGVAIDPTATGADSDPRPSRPIDLGDGLWRRR